MSEDRQIRGLCNKGSNFFKGYVSSGKQNVDLLKLSLDSYMEAYELNNENEYATSGIGRAKLELAQPVEALIFYQKTLAENPKNTYALRGVGDAYRKLSNWEDAIRHFEIYLEYKPSDSHVFVRMSCCFRNLEQFNDQKRFAKKALYVSDSDPMALVHLASAHYSLEEYSDAEVVYIKLLDLDNKKENHLDYYIKLGNISKLNKKYEDAGRYYETAREIFPESHLPIVGLADVARFNGDHEKGAELILSIIHEDYENPRLLTRLADAYMNLNKIDKAEKLYRQGLAHEDDVFALLGLAACEYGRGNFEFALEKCDHALKKHPNNARLMSYKNKCASAIKEAS